MPIYIRPYQKIVKFQKMMSSIFCHSMDIINKFFAPKRFVCSVQVLYVKVGNLYFFDDFGINVKIL